MWKQTITDVGRIGVLLLLLGLIGTPARAAEGVTDTEIHIGLYGPLSGPAKLWETAVRGSELACMMVNERGGIHGRKIVPHILDDSYNPAKTKAGVKRLHESVGIFAWAGGVGTANGLAVKDYLVKRKVPWVGPLSGAKAWFWPPKRNIFALYPAYRFEAAELCQYAVEKMGKSRIAIVYQDDRYGEEGLIGAKQGLEKYRLSLVEALPVAKTESELDSAVMRLRRAEAEVVLVWLNPFSTLRLIKVARGSGYSPQWMSTTALASFSTFYPVSRGLIKGMITANSTTYEDTQLALYREARSRLAPAHKWDNTYLGGLHVANVLIEAMQRCGRNLTRERVITVLEKLEKEKTLGGQLAFHPFDPDNPLCRLGHRRIYLQKCLADGRRKFLTDWIDIDDRILKNIVGE